MAKTVYLWDRTSRIFTGATLAQPDIMNPGQYIMPAFSAEDPPPNLAVGQAAFRNAANTAWTVGADPGPQPEVPADYIAAITTHNADATSHAAAIGSHNDSQTAHAAAITTANAASIATHNIDALAHNQVIATAIAAHNTDESAHAALFGTKIRKRLTADTTFYLRSDGNNANTGLGNTAASAWQTTAGALVNLRTFDQAGYTATLSLQGGIEFGGITFSEGGFTGRINLISTDANNLGSVNFIQILSRLPYLVDIRNIRITGQVVVQAGSTAILGNGAIVAPAASTTSSVVIMDGGRLILSGALSFTGNGFRALTADAGEIVAKAGTTIDFEGYNAGYSVVHASNGGQVVLSSATLTGSAVGRRYNAGGLGRIITLKGEEGIPGTIAGTTSTGGQYV